MKLENKEYEIKSTTKCSCGYQFKVNDLKELKRINQPGFYGNAVKHYSHAICPKCGKEVVLLLKQKGQTYVVLDTAVENTENTVQAPTENVETETDDINGIVCPVCGKVCKSQIGLNSHLKTHENN